MKPFDLQELLKSNIVLTSKKNPSDLYQRQQIDIEFLPEFSRALEAEYRIALANTPVEQFSEVDASFDARKISSFKLIDDALIEAGILKVDTNPRKNQK